ARFVASQEPQRIAIARRRKRLPGKGDARQQGHAGVGVQDRDGESTGADMNPELERQGSNRIRGGHPGSDPGWAGRGVSRWRRTQTRWDDVLLDLVAAPTLASPTRLALLAFVVRWCGWWGRRSRGPRRLGARLVSYVDQQRGHVLAVLSRLSERGTTAARSDPLAPQADRDIVGLGV